MLHYRTILFVFFFMTSWLGSHSALAAESTPSSATADDSTPATERIVIVGDYRATTVSEAPTSVTVLTQDEIDKRAASHVEEVLNAIPNLNFSGGSSRARFIQIRGIGERSQFVDPITSSVGLLIDGIQYSGLGQAAQLFDISQMEVYRGPQSGRFGADALAGMLVLESTQGSTETTGLWHLGLGNYGERQGGFAVGGELGELGRARLSVYQQRTDGFTRNDYLGRDDTQSRSEQMFRFNLFSDIADDWQLRTTLHAMRQNNGYDAFSLDNTRTTLSDQPGQDDLSARAGRVQLRYFGHANSELQLSYSVLSADSVYSYDEDWSYVGIAPGWEYSSFDSYQRQRQDQTFELRWLSTNPIQVGGIDHDWVIGWYGYQREEQLTRDFFNFETDLQDQFSSNYDDSRNALYGEWKSYLNSQWTLTSGARLERYDNDYQDNNQITATPKDTMWGGRLSLSYQPHAQQLWYATLARGYKIGGVNGEALGQSEGSGVPELQQFLRERATFAPELLSSLEVGQKWFSADQRLQLNTTVFYQQRDDMQLKTSVNRQQLFIGYIETAASGRNVGLELELRYALSDRLRSQINLGWLDTEVNGFITEDGIDMSGREQAHAPNYTYHIGLDYQLTESLNWALQVDGKDSFYYSDSHNQRSAVSHLLHSRIDWQLDAWQLSLWARNLTDEQVGVRGFYFGNDPRIEYQTRLYEQWGEPRRVGISARYSF